jgi:biopolymer transport protein ExbD
MARVGLALILLGASFYIGSRLWEATRIWVPVNFPISLSPGHIKTNEFKLNLDSSYVVFIAIDRTSDYDNTLCLAGVQTCDNKPSIVRASWTLDEAQKPIATGSTNHEQNGFGCWDAICREAGTFTAEKGGHYSLDVDILEDGSGLNSANPRLMVQDQGQHWLYGPIGTIAFFVATIFIMIGLILLARSIFTKLRERRDRMRVSFTSPGPQAGEVYLSGGRLRPKQNDPYTTNTKLRIWLGVGMLLLGIASSVAIYHWLHTRTFTALDMPVSLARGHIRTGPFRINLKDSYMIDIDTGEIRQPSQLCSSYGTLKTSWVLYKDGQVADSWYEPTPDSYLGWFAGEKGTYDLDVTILSDTSCLDTGHPRLQVHIDNYDKKSYTDRAALWLWISAFIAATGQFLFFLNIGLFRNTESPDPLRLTGSSNPEEYFQWAQKLRLKKAFTGLPSFGLFGAICAVVFLIPIWIITSWHRTSVGLRVLLLKSGASVVANDRWAVPTVVRIGDVEAGKEPELYVGSTLIAWNDLRTQLNQEILRHPPGQPVYVEADPDIPWADIVYVVDVARGSNAKVVLVTTKPHIQTK